MIDTILYAGYGANRDPEMIKAIIGVEPKVIGSIAIQGVELCVQRLDQTPSDVSPAAPVAASVRQILDTTWGNDSGFETYTIRTKEGNEVDATLFELTPDQRALIAEWELIEFGWYQPMQVSVRLEGGTGLEAETEGLGKGQIIDRVEDGIDYSTYLNDRTKMHQNAEKARQEYLKRQQTSR